MALLLLLAAVQDPATVRPTAPKGFSIRKVSGPEVTFPMFAAFDDRGRLFVTESSGGDLYVELQRLTRKCRIRLLEDRDGDGAFETSTVFADGLTPSMGLAWRNGRLYAADPPDLVTLEDTDGDGKADRRTVILTGFGHRDNGSLHGLVFGPDNLLYFTMGQPDGYRLRRPDGTFLEGKTGALLRARPDGSHPEALTRGFENLIEIVWTPRGEMIGTVNWFQKPRGGLRDALVHQAEGGLYPLHSDRGGTPLPITGDPLPAVSLYPAFALSGLMRYRGDLFRNHLFSAQHNARKVVRHVLAREGSTFRSEDHDFVTCDHPDFHPSDVLEDADGSLLVVDTGAWYVQHCPTGKIRNSRAPGGIYRVRPVDAKKEKDPWGLRIPWDKASHDQLAGHLADPRPAVRDRAVRLLQERGDVSRLAAVLSSPVEISVKLRAVRCLAGTALRDALATPEAPVAAAIARALGYRRNRDSARALDRLLSRADPTVRFAAAEALAHCGDAKSLPAIWRALAEKPDRFLEHALVHAAHRLADGKALEAALDHPHPRVQKAALILLDQPPREGAARDQVIPRVASPDEGLRRAALGILRKQPEWAKQVVELVRGWLDKARLPAEERRHLRDFIIAFQADPGLQAAVAAALRKTASPGLVTLLLRTLAETSLPRLPDAWREAIRKLLRTPSGTEAVRVLAAYEEKGFEEELLAIVRGPDQPPEARLEAIRALVPHRPDLPAEAVKFLIGQLDPDVAPLRRLAAAEILRRARLTDKLRGDPLVAEPPGDKRSREDRLAAFASLLSGGDPARGRKVFFGRKVGCGACHRVGNEGGAIGPDLTKIGAVRAGRDLLESILFPASTFAQGYETYLVRTKEGDVRSGIIARRSEDAVVLRDSAGGEVRIRKERIQAMKRAEKSIMPEGLEQALGREEFRDLLAFLRSLK